METLEPGPCPKCRCPKGNMCKCTCHTNPPGPEAGEIFFHKPGQQLMVFIPMEMLKEIYVRLHQDGNSPGRQLIVSQVKQLLDNEFLKQSMKPEGCKCPPSCPWNCKGECGCQACSDCYNDYLSAPEA